LGKRLEVYLTNEEARKLEELCEVNGNNKSRLIKNAISILHANGSGNHNGHGLRVEIPRSMQLKGIIRQALREIPKEDELAKKQESHRLWKMLEGSLEV